MVRVIPRYLKLGTTFSYQVTAGTIPVFSRVYLEAHLLGSLGKLVHHYLDFVKRAMRVVSGEQQLCDKLFLVFVLAFNRARLSEHFSLDSRADEDPFVDVPVLQHEHDCE